MNTEIIEKRNSFDKMEKSKISIILPVFNGEDMLNQCVDNIISQDLDLIELILIDEKSSDETFNIMQTYADTYPFINVFKSDKYNSRNLGLKESTSEYVTFLNVNDFYIDNTSLRKMYEILNESQTPMIYSNNFVLNDNNVFVKSSLVNSDLKEEMEGFNYGIPLFLERNIFRKSWLISNQIKFPELLEGQEEVFLARALCKVNSIENTSINFVASSVNEKEDYSKEELYDLLHHFRMVFELFSDKEFSYLKDDYERYMVNTIRDMNPDLLKQSLMYCKEIFHDDKRLLKKLSQLKDLNYNSTVKVIIRVNKKNINYLSKTISSVTNQSYTNIEVNVVNPENLDISNVKYIDKTFESLKTAVEDSMYDFVYIMDSGDLLKYNALKLLINNSFDYDSDVVLISNESFLNDKNSSNNNYISHNSYQKIFYEEMNVSNKFFKGKYLTNNIDLFKYEDNDFFDIFLHMNSLLSEKVCFNNDEILSHMFKDYSFKSSANYLKNASKDSISLLDMFKLIISKLKHSNNEKLIKTYYEYIIKKIICLLDSSLFVNVHNYIPESEQKILKSNKMNYARYYGSNSKYVGLNYAFANEFFQKSKEFFKSVTIDNNYINNHLNNEISIILSSDSFEDYKHDCNIERINNLKKQEKITQFYQSQKDKQQDLIKKLTNDNYELNNENRMIKEEIVKINKENNGYLHSTSWNITKKLRKNE